MSLIPKIRLGQKNRKNNFHIPSMTHGTSEIGFVVPSYSRNLINNTHIKIGARSAVRLSPLFVPTMGDLSLRHYHCFVPFNKIWTPFDAFLDRKPFAFPSGYSAVPTAIPWFKVGDLIKFLIRGNISNPSTYDFDDLRWNLTARMYYRSNVSVTGEDETWKEVDNPQFIDMFDPNGTEPHDRLNSLFNSLSHLRIEGSDRHSYGGVPSILACETNQDDFKAYYTFYGYLNSGEIGLRPYNLWKTTQSNAQTHRRFVEHVNNLSFPSIDSCDFCDSFKDDRYDYMICYNFNGPWKRLRSIFLGLGYCFNPFDTTNVTPLKLLAFYRCYWSLFGVNRGVNFQDTYCALLTRHISNTHSIDISDLGQSGQLFNNFLRDLCNCTYTTPGDYFSSSVLNTNQGIADAGDEILVQSFDSSSTQSAVASSTQYNQSPARPRIDDRDHYTAIGIEMAMRLLRWVNRNTVVGSKIYDSLRARFGNIDVNDETSEGVVRIGETSTQINIGAIFNQSDTVDGAPLGDFAGVGTGETRGETERFDFETDSFGCVITLTVVVPRMGYFQGMLRENSDGIMDNFEMYDPTFDACGWQTVRMNELVADRQFYLDPDSQSGIFTPNRVGTNLGFFGYQPRYTHMKVGFNRCIGDISLPHMQDSMLPYTLDRFFPQRKYELPANNPQWFRSGTRGETNRIFQVVAPTDDHVIWQLYFDVDLDMPMKSISDSYDTHLADDTTTVEVSHE